MNTGLGKGKFHKITFRKVATRGLLFILAHMVVEYKQHFSHLPGIDIFENQCIIVVSF
jgi:hypothetical protein